MFLHDPQGAVIFAPAPHVCTQNGVQSHGICKSGALTSPKFAKIQCESVHQMKEICKLQPSVADPKAILWSPLGL